MKSVLVAMVVVFATLTVVEAGIQPGTNTKKAVNITLEQALLRPDLVQAMYAQIDPSFLDQHQESYIETVTLGSVDYRIKGSYEQWVAFFKNSVGIGTN